MSSKSRTNIYQLPPKKCNISIIFILLGLKESIEFIVFMVYSFLVKDRMIKNLKYELQYELLAIYAYLMQVLRSLQKKKKCRFYVIENRNKTQAKSDCSTYDKNMDMISTAAQLMGLVIQVIKIDPIKKNENDKKKLSSR